MNPETPQERRRRLARERKQRQREREKRLGMADMRLNLSQAERDTVEQMATARGFDDVTEYMFALVRADKLAFERDPSRNPAADIVTGHAPQADNTADVLRSIGEHELAERVEAGGT